MYNKQGFRIERTKEEFYRVLISWYSTPYYVVSDNKVIGYFTYKNDVIYEIIYNDDFDTILDAALSLNDHLYFNLSTNCYSDELLNKINCFEVIHNYMYKIINIKNVLKFIDKENETLPNLGELELVRYILGDPYKDGLSNGLFFINETNGG